MPGPGHILDIDVPQVEPTGAPGGDFEHIQSSPEMFGGLGARAEETLGRGVGAAGEAGLGYLIETNRLQDQIHASELHSDFYNKAGDLFSSFAQKSGRSAIEAQPGFEQSVRGLQQDAVNNSGSLYTRSLVSQNTRYAMDWFFRQAAEHTARARTQWGKDTAQGNAATATNTGALAVNTGTQPDFGMLDRQLSTVDSEWRNFYDPDGLDPGTMKLQVSKQKGATVRNWVETAATNLKDPNAVPHALGIFERYAKDIDPQTRVVLDRYVKTMAQGAFEDRMATRFTAAPGRSEDTGQSPEMRGLLDTIHGSETPTGGYDTLYGGGSIHQAKPGYDYEDHPAIYFKGPFGQTSAAGRYQITHSTWQSESGKFGVTDFTPVSQDEFAAKLANQAYGSAIRGGRFGQFGQLSGDLATDLRANANNPQFLDAVGRSLASTWTSLPGGKEPNAQTASFADRFAKNIAINRGDQSSVPNAQDVIDRINADPALASRPDLRDGIIKRSLAKIAQQERVYTVNHAQQTQASDNAELQLFDRLHNNDPTLTLAQIQGAPLSREAHERLTHEFETFKGGTGEKTLGPQFYDVFRNIHSAPDAPGHIAGTDALYPFVDHGVTYAGFEKLKGELDGVKANPGEAEMKKNFIAAARGQIIGFEAKGAPDVPGQQRFQKFLPEFYTQYAAARAEGKSPADLLSPGSKDYLGKVVDGYKVPIAQAYSEKLNAQTQAFDISSVHSLDQAMAAYHANQLTRDQARTLVGEHPEWGVTFAPPIPPAPQVPLSTH